MPLISIPVVARDKHIMYAAIIVLERDVLGGHMGDFFERRYEGYHEAVADLHRDASGLLVCDHDVALERFTKDPALAVDFLREHFPYDWTLKRLPPDRFPEKTP